MITSDRIAAQLLELNNAQLGSFGEFIFAAQMAGSKECQVVRRHRQRADFLVDNVAVDVKTSVRGLKRPTQLARKFVGNRVDGVSYAMVEFMSDGARVSLEGESLGGLSWRDVERMWAEWRPLGKDSKTRSAPDENVSTMRVLRAELTDFFHSIGLRPRILYRTCQAEFGREAPANLRPSVRHADRVTVYLDFHDHRIGRGNVRRIFAFPDERSDELPPLATTRLHVAKVDLERMPPEFCFHDIDDLKARFVPE